MIGRRSVTRSSPAACYAGIPAQERFSFDDKLQSTFLQYTDRHGVQGLLAPNFARQIPRSAGLQIFVRPLRRRRISGLLEILQRRETVTVLEALTQRGIRPLLMKGAPLAYTHYRSPHLRPRGDTDVLIRRVDREPQESSCPDWIMRGVT